MKHNQNTNSFIHTKNGISDKNRFTFIISSKTKNGQASLANIKGVIVLNVDHTEEMMERIS